MASNTAEKLDLLGMLWYHGPKSQREAEQMLESCKEDNCYLIRENKGSLYLSARANQLCNHLPIEKSRRGYCLTGHHNQFRTLKELVSHHQKHSVYVDSGEFTLQVSCHKDYNAYAMTYINELHGPCTIQVKGDAIAIRNSNRIEIGNWPYKVIRQFRFNDEKKQFTFQSGSRGPFGVAEYLFKLHNRTYYNLQETVNRIAGGNDNNGSRSKDNGYRPPVPPHRKSDTHQHLPMIRTLRDQRSTSSPDLSQNLTKFRSKTGSVRSDNGSTEDLQKVYPEVLSSQVIKPVTKNTYDVPQPYYNEPQSDSKLVTESAYKVPSPSDDHQKDPKATTGESTYDVPRPYNDPRNDYQVPRPVEKTYMVPRPCIITESSLRSQATRESPMTILEHSYEDPDNIKNN